MLKRIFAFALIITAAGQNFAQDSKAYAQTINGTKLSFVMQPVPAGTFKMGNKNGNQMNNPFTMLSLMLSGWANMR